MRRSFAATLVAGCVSVPGLVVAQEKGDVGITMGYPASIGILWHASEKLAIRPEFSFVHNENESESTFTRTESSTNSINVGASALFYVRKWDRVQSYFSPRYSFGRVSSKTTSVENAPTSKNNSHQFTGAFGVQYSPHERFSVFGEVGGGVTRTSSKISSGESEAHSTQIGTRSGVGVIFYF